MPPPDWDPKKTTAENAKALADYYAGQSGGGGGTASTANSSHPPPAGFTKEVPGSNGTVWFNPESLYTWKYNANDPKGDVFHVNTIEADRIMGEGWSAKQKQENTAAPTGGQPLDPVLARAGFVPIAGTDKYYQPPVAGAKGASAAGKIATYNSTTGQWYTANATPADLTLVRAAAGQPAPAAATTTQPTAAAGQPIASAATTPPPGGTPQTPVAGGQPAPAPAPTAPGSPYQQVNAATASGGITPDRYGPPLALTVPFTYDPKTGMQNILDAQGKASQQFVPFMASYTPYVANQPTATAPLGPAAAAAPIPGTSAGLAAARPEANQGVPTPVAAAGAAPSPIRPPNVGDAGLAAGIGATGAPATGGIDLSAYHGQWLADGSAWFPIRGGATVPPEMVSLIARTWADTPGNIPQMLGIAARESGGNPGSVGVNGPQTGAPGTRDAGVFQINELNWPALGLNAQSVLDPVTNVQAARQLFDRAQGAGPWGGPDIYNPRGYAWAQNLESGRPPPNTVGGIRPPNTGDAGLTRPIGAAAPLAQPGGMLPSARDQFLNTPTDPFNTGLPRGAPTPAPAPPSAATGAADQTPLGPAAAAAPPPMQLSIEGPQTVHYGDMSHGLNPAVILRGNGLQSTGNLAQDAAIAAEIVRNQAPGGAYSDILANKAPGAATTFQSPLSGGLQNEVRTDAGYAFSPGNVNSGPSLRSPMGGTTPVMTPQGVVMRGANGIDQTPAAQAVAYQNAGYGVPQLGGVSGRDIQRDPTTGLPMTYPLAPTSNVGAVIQAGQAQAREPQQAGQFFEGSANLAGLNPNSNLSLPGVGYASAANLPSENQLLALGQGNQQIQSQLNREWAAAQVAAQAGAGGGPETGVTRGFAAGGSFLGAGGISASESGIRGSESGIRGGYGRGTPDLRLPNNIGSLQQAFLDLKRQQGAGYMPRPGMPPPIPQGAGMAPRPYAAGGSFMTTQPTMFPMANGGMAMTSEYGQPEKITVTPMAAGGSFTTPKPTTTTYDEPAPPSTGTDLTNTGTPNLDYPAPPAYSNPPGGEAPTNQGNTQDPNPPPPPPPGALPPLSGYTGAMDTNPELANQLELARQQQARDTYGYQYRAAGVPLPTGISSMTRPDNLAPGQFWQPIDYTNQIQQLEARLAALGPQQGWTPLDPAQIAMIRSGGGGEGPGLQGYRNPDPATADMMEMQNKQQLDQYLQAQDLMRQIGNLRAQQPTPFQLPGGQATQAPGTPGAFQDVVSRVPALDQPMTGATLSALNFDPSQQSPLGPQKRRVAVAA